MYYFCCELWLIWLKEEGLLKNKIKISILSFLSIKPGSILVKNYKHLRSPLLILLMLFYLTHLQGNFGQTHCFKCHLDTDGSNVYVQSGPFYWASHTNTNFLFNILNITSPKLNFDFTSNLIPLIIFSTQQVSKNFHFQYLRSKTLELSLIDLFLLYSTSNLWIDINRFCQF